MNGISLKITLIAIVVFQLIALPAFAADLTGISLTPSGEITAAGSGSEFVSGNYPGAILMPVNLWGSVQKPGIHHIPTRTDLVTLLSLAGGPGADARMDDIIIKRRTGKEEQIIKVNGDDLLNRTDVHSPVLEANDIVIVPRDKPTISNNTVATLSFVSTLLSVILAGYAVSQLAKH